MIKDKEKAIEIINSLNQHKEKGDKSLWIYVLENKSYFKLMLDNDETYIELNIDEDLNEELCEEDIETYVKLNGYSISNARGLFVMFEALGLESDCY